MGSNILNNISVDHTTVGNTVEVPVITSEIADDPLQLYRCSDNKIFTPLLIVATNIDTANYQHVRLVDCDLTDGTSEKVNDCEDEFIFSFTVAPDDTTILGEKELLGLKFRYGIGGYNSVSGTGTRVYIAGVED